MYSRRGHVFRGVRRARLTRLLPRLADLGEDAYGFFYYSGSHIRGCGRILAVVRPGILYVLESGGPVLYGRGSRDVEATGDPFRDLKVLSSAARRLGRGIPILGFISYEALVFSEPSLRGHVGFGNEPLAVFMIPELAFSEDLCDGRVRIISPWRRSSADPLIELLSSGAPGSDGDPASLELEEVSHDKKSFEDLVLRVKERIYDGEVFQLVVSRYKVYRGSGPFVEKALQRLVERIFEVPYAYMIKHRELKIIGASPEPLLIVRGKVAETYPIAGTRRRIPGKELQTYSRLVRNEKERAEHMMLVDLARNDLGRASLPASVRVVKLMYPEILPNVIHIVSMVRSSLGSFEDSFEALRALFPAGTVSGAPKPRAMKLIWDFEARPRGVYAGVTGYVEDLVANFAITIRTAVVSGDRVRIQAGAGIVHDSRPGDEFLETENKMAFMEKILGAVQ